MAELYRVPMLLTLPNLKELVTKLETARRDSSAPGQGAYCEAPNKDEQGNTERWEPKPRARRPVGHAYPDGTVLEDRDVESEGGLLIVKQKGIRVPLGMHGRASLAIDPDTGAVRCAKCAGEKR